jgi:hypothetical protein
MDEAPDMIPLPLWCRVVAFVLGWTLHGLTLGYWWLMDAGQRHSEARDDWNLPSLRPDPQYEFDFEDLEGAA